MPCQFCGKPCNYTSWILLREERVHTACLVAAYDTARAVVEAQRSNLEELRTLLLGDKWTQANADNLSPLSSLAMLLREYEREHNWKTDEDLDATREFVVDIREFLAKLRAALEGVEPEGEGQKAESTRQ